MILAQGELYDTDRQQEILDRLPAQLNATLSAPPLSVETVIGAVDGLAQMADRGELDGLLKMIDTGGLPMDWREVVSLFRRENLEFKLDTELGTHWRKGCVTAPPHGAPLRKQPMPLGVLLHIAAGNVDGLPAYSVVEGLLTGNLNLLKLPQADNGFSMALLQRLIALEPRLKDWIYVFDTPSADVAAIKRLADLADGIVVWGGDEAVSAARRLAPPGVRLIEWGHKLSFAYVSGAQPSGEELDALAEHLFATRQLLCSSCQVIYVDTPSMAALDGFARRFLPRLERAAALHATGRSLSERAEATLRRRHSQMETMLGGAEKQGRKTLWGTGCSLTLCEDSVLELSDVPGGCLVKRLPREVLVPVLREKKEYLQTAGLICPPEERRALAEQLARCGVVRITTAGDMSRAFPGEAHDGDYALMRYLRMVDVEER